MAEGTDSEPEAQARETASLACASGSEIGHSHPRRVYVYQPGPWKPDSWRVFVQSRSANGVYSTLTPLQVAMRFRDPAVGGKFERDVERDEERRFGTLERIADPTAFPLLPPRDIGGQSGFALVPMPTTAPGVLPVSSRTAFPVRGRRGEQQPQWGRGELADGVRRVAPDRLGPLDPRHDEPAGHAVPTDGDIGGRCRGGACPAADRPRPPGDQHPPQRRAAAEADAAADRHRSRPRPARSRTGRPTPQAALSGVFDP